MYVLLHKQIALNKKKRALKVFKSDLLIIQIHFFGNLEEIGFDINIWQGHSICNNELK